MKRDPFQHIIDEALLKYPESTVSADLSDVIVAEFFNGAEELSNWQMRLMLKYGVFDYQVLKNKISQMTQGVY